MRPSGREVERAVVIVLGEALGTWYVLGPYPMLYGFATDPKWSSPPAVLVLRRQARRPPSAARRIEA